MSTYQLYDFKAIDKPLTNAQQRKAAQLSSRLEEHPSRYKVAYNWGNFSHDPMDVVDKFFDAGLYMSKLVLGSSFSKFHEIDATQSCMSHTWSSVEWSCMSVKSTLYSILNWAMKTSLIGLTTTKTSSLCSHSGRSYSLAT